MLNFWDALTIFILACVLYAIIQKIIMGVLTAKAIKAAKFLGTSKQEVLNQASTIVKEVTDEMQKAILKEVDALDKKYIHLIDPESGLELKLEKASKKGTKLHNEKIRVEKDGTVKTAVKKTTRKKKEEK